MVSSPSLLLLHLVALLSARPRRATLISVLIVILLSLSPLVLMLGLWCFELLLLLLPISLFVVAPRVELLSRWLLQFVPRRMLQLADCCTDTAQEILLRGNVSVII